MNPSTPTAPERAQASTGCRDEQLGHKVSSHSRPVLPSGGYVTFLPRVKLVTLSTVRAIRGTDAEEVAKMVDNMLHPQHIRFAFNTSLKPDRGARDLRFWTVELSVPALVKKFSIQEAIEEILGTRESFKQGELEIAWTIGTTQISRLLNGRFLTKKNNRITRASLEAFLWIRWAANNPT